MSVHGLVVLRRRWRGSRATLCLSEGFAFLSDAAASRRAVIAVDIMARSPQRRSESSVYCALLSEPGNWANVVHQNHSARYIDAIDASY